jgi:anthranilate/para-aminobenzoate synthase component I
MEIIAGLETSPRGIYTGAIGFISPHGRAVLNVAIRTVELHGQMGTMGTGSGITICSDPELEYEETRLKALFLKQALRTRQGHA